MLKRILIALMLFFLPLKEGAAVDCSTKSSLIFSQMGEDIDKRLDELRGKFEQLLEDLRKIPEGEDFKKLRKDLEQLVEELKQAGSSAREKIEREILPLLKQEMERLKERLQKFEQNEKLKPLEDQIEKIRQI